MRTKLERPMLVDGLAAAALGLFAFRVLGVRESNPALAVVATVLAAAMVPVARHRPAIATAGALSIFWLTLLSPRYAWIALAPLAYALYRGAQRHRTLAAAGLLAAGLTGPVATALPSWRHLGGVVPFGLVLCTAWALGLAVRRHRLRGEALVQGEAQRAAERAAHERARIARELHDVVTHGMSVITVQAAYGRLVAAADPAKGAEALAVIETTGRQSLAELRRLLNVLRGDEPGPADDEPAPGLADLPRLAERTAAAGVRVDVTVYGTPETLGPGLELSAYRIVQEALTNVVRHAGTDHARVVLEHRPDALVIDVADRGRGGEVRSYGHGLTGMRERATLFGGTLRAGPRPDGGFLVSATLPRLESQAP